MDPGTSGTVTLTEKSLANPGAVEKAIADVFARTVDADRTNNKKAVKAALHDYDHIPSCPEIGEPFQQQAIYLSRLRDRLVTPSKR
jgi:hypothetical protein